MRKVQMNKMPQESPETAFEIMTRNQVIWDAIYADCAAAKHSIEFEQYIMRDDDIGKKFLALFTQKAVQGVKIRLLLDRFGSRQLFNSPLIEDLRAAGGEVHFYNNIGWANIFMPSTWYPRNHTKMTLIDSEIAYLGGACFADYMRDWQDMHVRITGAFTRDIAFMWDHRNAPSKPSDSAPLCYVVSKPDRVYNPVYTELLERIDEANESVLIATPYFLPPRRLRIALYKAAARGVEVKVIMSEATDVLLALRTAQSYFPRLLRRGLRVALYRGTVFHAKYMIVDKAWATLGSTNIDYISLLRNREANILVEDKEIIEQLRDNYAQDWANAEEVDINFWNNMPLPIKLYGYAGRMVKKLL
jgi:cardiolipin synthase A/B